MNPLVTVQFRIPFDQVQASHVEPAIDQLLTAAAERLEETTRSAHPLEDLDVMTEPLIGAESGIAKARADVVER